METLPNTVFGLMTLIIVTQGGVIARLYSDGKKLQSKFDTSKDDRLTDMREMVEKTTGPLSTLAQTMPLINDKLRSSKEA